KLARLPIPPSGQASEGASDSCAKRSSQREDCGRRLHPPLEAEHPVALSAARFAHDLADEDLADGDVGDAGFPEDVARNEGFLALFDRVDRDQLDEVELPVAIEHGQRPASGLMTVCLQPSAYAPASRLLAPSPLLSDRRLRHAAADAQDARAL